MQPPSPTLQPIRTELSITISPGGEEALEEARSLLLAYPPDVLAEFDRMAAVHRYSPALHLLQMRAKLYADFTTSGGTDVGEISISPEAIPFFSTDLVGFTEACVESYTRLSALLYDTYDLEEEVVDALPWEIVDNSFLAGDIISAYEDMLAEVEANLQEVS